MKIVSVAAVAVSSMLWFPCASVSAVNPKEKQAYSQMYDLCLRRGGSANCGAVSACAEAVSEQAKAEMNILYKKIYERLAVDAPGDEFKLEKSQKSWLVYRSIHCDLAGSHIGSPMYAYCPMRLNIERVDELRQLAGE